VILFFDNVKLRSAGKVNNAFGIDINALFEADKVLSRISFSIPAGNSFSRLPSMPSVYKFFNLDKSGNEVN